MRVSIVSMQRSNRQATILSVISATRITSQGELARLLRKNGFKVTQASISRDLAALGIEKVNGVYAVKNISGVDSRSAAVISFERAGPNLCVAKCSPGMAPGYALKIDDARIPGIVGTIAGDDTIFIAVKESGVQSSVENAVKALFQTVAV